MPSNTNKSNNDLDPKFSRKSSVGVYFLLMMIAWSGLAVFTVWLGQSETAAVAVFCIGIATSAWISFRLQTQHRVRHPKTIADKNNAMWTGLIAGSIVLITALLLITNQGMAAVGFLAVCAGVGFFYIIFTSIFGLLSPFAKDRKSAIWLTIIVVILLTIVSVSQRENNRGIRNEDLKANPQLPNSR